MTYKNTSYHGGHIKWYFGDGSSDTAQTVTHAYEKDSVYTVSLVSNIGTACKDSITKKVPVNVPHAAFSYVIDTCTGRVTFINKSFRHSKQEWNFGDGSADTYDTGAFHVYPYKGDYTVTLRINQGTNCEDIATTQVHTIRDYAIEVKVPNVFSPNGDGINDFFDVDGLSNCLDYHMYVYDRWGVLVSSAIGHSTLRWDGRSSHSGNPVPEGVYYYVVKAPGFKDLVGSVTVVR